MTATSASSAIRKPSSSDGLASPGWVVILTGLAFTSMPQVGRQKRLAFGNLLPPRKSSRPGAVTISVGSHADSDTFYREALTRSSGEGPGCGVKDQWWDRSTPRVPLQIWQAC